MEWVFGAIIVVVFALYLWASYSASRKVQPFIDDLLDSHPHDVQDANPDRESSV